MCVGIVVLIISVVCHGGELIMIFIIGIVCYSGSYVWILNVAHVSSGSCELMCWYCGIYH